MISRPGYVSALNRAIDRSPVTALLGPRQCGKTTLARAIAATRPSVYHDLEAPSDQRRLQNPEFYLEGLQGLIILDEIQQMPELFNILRVLVDRPASNRHFLILGSASPDLVKGMSQSLAGRVEFIELMGFSLAEVAPESGHDDNIMKRLWLRGGFPRSYLAGSDADSSAWREGFVRTFLERDLPQLGITIPAAAMRRFWTMLAHLHGQTWNASELGRSLSLSDKTTRSHLDLLTGTYMVRQLQPWHENLKKRQVKSPKIYLRDPGLLHRLLDIDTDRALHGHPRVGASWEGFALEQTLQIIKPGEAYFWATHGGAELDLLFLVDGRRYGMEFKYSDAPRVSRSMRTAMTDLELEHLWIVCPTRKGYPVEERITVAALDELPRISSWRPTRDGTG